MDLSVIYPVHISFQTRYIIKRLQACLTNTNEGLPNAEHVIILSGRNSYVRKAQKLVQQLRFTIKIVRDSNPTRPYSPGIARNRAVKHATTNNLLFWDIDLLGSPQLFRAIPKHIREIEQNSKVFQMYPCMYLCEQYSKHFQQDFEQLWDDATNLRVNTLEHFAMATSTILCNKQHFLDIGAFDEDFIGHMGEDLELLHRLTLKYHANLINEGYNQDKPHKVPALQLGFRRFFTEISTPNLKRKLYTIHQHHSTRIGSNYKKQNRQNRALLRSKLNLKSDAIRNISSIKFSQLPDYLCQPPIIERTRAESAFKKLRKLILSPVKFLKDSRFYR